jgi:hypothetical protein
VCSTVIGSDPKCEGKWSDMMCGEERLVTSEERKLQRGIES